MTRLRAADEHHANMAALAAGEGRLVDVPTRTTWCPIHGNPASPVCSACAGDHVAGEHHSLPAIPSCPHCRPIPAQHTTHADRSTR